MSKHPVFCSLLQRLHDDHGFSHDPSCALAEFFVLPNKAKKLTSCEVCKIMLLKENRDGFYKAFSHVPLFVVLEQVAKRSSLCHRCTSAIFLPGKKGIAKIIQAISMAPLGVVAAVTISVLSMKCFSDCALPTPPGPTPLWDLDPSRTIGRTSVVSQASRLSTFLECEQTWCFLHPSDSTRPETE